MEKRYSIEGQSFVFNLLFILINITGVALITAGFHEAYAAKKWILVSLGGIALAISITGLVVFKGKLFMAYVSRILVGGLFIVSGLIKANDPLGFSYKLEEYFEDGALAFRIKEWFSIPEFSLEFLIPYALTLSVIICIVEIVLGVLVLIGGKVKLVSSLLVAMMIFFTFLTWHTANCDANKKFVDRDRYPMKSEIAQIKLEESKTNKDIKIIGVENEKLVVDEMKPPQCVTDCGCFGDAMKGSVGRSLTPSESLWKDIILFYFIGWIFFSMRRIKQNTAKDNSYIIPISLVVIVFFSYVFGWFFPVTFGVIAIFGSLWMLQVGGRFLGNHWGSALFVTLVSLIMVCYVLMYEPIKDYRPYAVGNNLKEKMLDGKMGVFESGMLMKNLKTGEEFFMTQNEYMDTVRKIWENPDFKLVRMDSKEIVRGILPSIDSAQFNPSIDVAMLGAPEKAMKYIIDFTDKNRVEGVLLRDKSNNTDIEVIAEEYSPADYDSTQYELIREISMINPEITEISVRDYLLNAPTAFILFSKDLEHGNFSEIDRIRSVYAKSKELNIPFVMVCSGSREQIDAFRKKYKLDVPAFGIDFIELKVIARSNPALMILQDGVVKGKYPHRSIPTFDWIQKHVLNKK